MGVSKRVLLHGLCPPSGTMLQVFGFPCKPMENILISGVEGQTLLRGHKTRGGFESQQVLILVGPTIEERMFCYFHHPFCTNASLDTSY